MGKTGPRYNERARASSHLTTTARPHPNARDGGLKSAPIKKHVNVQPTQLGPEGEESLEYNGSAFTTPLVIETNKDKFTNLLPEAPTGKMTSKKRKRLEKFIEKQLKKEERGQLLKKLGEQTFSSELLRSSKSLGQGKLTAKQRLRLALNEERSGLPISDPDSRLHVEMDVDEEEDEERVFGAARREAVGRALAVNIPVEETPDVVDVQSKEEDVPAPSLIGQAFGSGLKKAPTSSITVVTTDGMKQSVSQQPAVLGGGLKRKSPEDTATVVTKKKKKQKKKGGIVETQNRGSSDSESGSDAGEEELDTPSAKARKSIWASDVVGGESLPAPPPSKPKVKDSKPVISVPKPPIQRAFHVPIPRPESIQASRISLPIVTEEQPIMETITHNDVTILCGETGSGKTTQVPQFLYEAGFGDPKHPKFPGLIGVTQPRRVAAVSMAKRVAEEMGMNDGTVAYQIRYDRGTVTKQTRIKFMTDGILLRELSGAAGGDGEGGDLVLSKYSCIVIDEAHERTVGTDVLIGWLTRIVKLRNSGKVKGVGPLKLIIMSATLRVEDFTENATLFPKEEKPPVVKVDGRQHKVVIHYNKRTPDLDYVAEAYKKIHKIHSTLPPGGILVFLSGQQEIQILVRKLQKAFPVKQAADSADKDRVDGEVEKPDGGLFDEAEGGDENALPVDITVDSDSDVDEEESDGEEEETGVLGGVSDDEDEELVPVFRNPDEDVSPLHVLPLYSLLPTHAQMRVFESPPEGHRLCVIATNVAETSLTIPGIKYVVDCGKVKERRYDTHTGVQTYSVGWTSQSSADQRAGRAGRVGSGHCYRLFSSAVFNDYFDKFSRPEMLRVPIEGVVLQMKAMGINQVVGFPFPTAPGKGNLRSAEKLLMHLGGLDIKSPNLKITEMGKLMSAFPISPRFAKMLITAAQQSREILLYILAIVAGMSVGDPFLRDEDIVGKPRDAQSSSDEESDTEKEQRTKKRGEFYKTMHQFAGSPPTSDSLRLLTAIGAYTANSISQTTTPTQFCTTHFLRPKAMDEIMKLQSQLLSIVKSTLSTSPAVKDLYLDPRAPPPTRQQCAMIRQVLLSGFCDQVAKLDEESPRGHKNAPMMYVTAWSGKLERFAIHPSSCLYRERPPPKWVVYEEVMGKEEKVSADNTGVIDLRGGKEEGGVKKMWMKGVTVVLDRWIADVAPESIVRMGKVADVPEPRFDVGKDMVVGFVTPTYGPKMWELPVREMEVPHLEGRVAVFARALIEGGVLSNKDEANVFKMLVPYLVTKPNTITKQWSKTQSKVMNILDTLAKSDIDSRLKLLLKWQTNSTFLLNEYLAWVPEEFHGAFTKFWPPVEVSQDGKSWKRKVGLVKAVFELSKRAGQKKQHKSWNGGVSDGDSDY